LPPNNELPPEKRSVQLERLDLDVVEAALPVVPEAVVPPVVVEPVVAPEPEEVVPEEAVSLPP
jgi:hypothetical protein